MCRGPQRLAAGFLRRTVNLYHAAAALFHAAAEPRRFEVQSIARRVEQWRRFGRRHTRRAAIQGKADGSRWCGTRVPCVHRTNMPYKTAAARSGIANAEPCRGGSRLCLSDWIYSASLKPVPRSCAGPKRGHSRRIHGHGLAQPLHVAATAEPRDLPMDLNTITAICRPGDRDDIQSWRTGDAWLAGGTWLFSEPQPDLLRLIDLAGLGWPALEIDQDGPRIGATCTLAHLAAADWPVGWLAAPLFRQCCRALLGSFKIWNAATVGGNLCMALPAGPMAALTAALDGVCVIWTPDGGQRCLPAIDFVVGPQQNALRPGEVLREIRLPIEAARRRTAFRQISLTPLGRSAALLIGTRAPSGAFAVTVTAATRRPIRLAFQAVPAPAELSDAIDRGIPDALYYDDLHGAPDWRRHMTFRFAEEIRRELVKHPPP